MSFPVPPNEAQRLSALHAYEILDTSPESDFDVMTRMAAHAFNMPTVVIGLMDSNRLWLKSRLGIQVTEIDRNASMCAHALMSPGETLVLENLREDRRFRKNPFVTQGPRFNFYAGAPLVDSKGFALGTIAVFDQTARGFNAAQRTSLLDLSSLVVSCLENRQKAKQLSQMAMSDHLTGLPNRAHFERALNAELAHSRRTGERLTVFFMDLDGFKEINDSHGHAAGDQVLAEVAQRLMAQVRQEDMVARFGGDEFAVFVRQRAHDSTELLAQRIEQAVAAPIFLTPSLRVSVGISIGLATFHDASNTVASLIARADQSLYQLKKSRKKLATLSGPIPLGN